MLLMCDCFYDLSWTLSKRASDLERTVCWSYANHFQPYRKIHKLCTCAHSSRVNPLQVGWEICCSGVEGNSNIIVFWFRFVKYFIQCVLSIYVALTKINWIMWAHCMRLPFSKCFFIIRIAAGWWEWAQITVSIGNVVIRVIWWHDVYLLLVVYLNNW